MTDARQKPLKLAVVGHTNVGKTSLLRTLTRDVGFGEVSHRPSTTRHVEGARLSVDGEPLLDLYDTPGLEDAIALLDFLERLERPGERLDGPARLTRFLDGSEARQRFEQEAKVLRQLLASDAGLYVIDAREPVLAKYRDELEVLAGCGKPLLPVLNFVSSASHREPDWREALARLGLHALVAFDSVAPAEDGERRLYESLALLLERSRPQLQRLIEDHEAQRLARRQAGNRLIAELLIDCAACRRSVAAQPVLEQGAVTELRDAIRQREQRCVEALLRLYAFRSADAKAADVAAAQAQIATTSASLQTATASLLQALQAWCWSWARRGCCPRSSARAARWKTLPSAACCSKPDRVKTLHGPPGTSTSGAIPKGPIQPVRGLCHRGDGRRRRAAAGDPVGR